MSEKAVCVGLTWWGQVNNEAITDIHCPVLIGAPEDFYQVPRLWFLIILGEEHQKQNMFVFATDCV